MHRDLAFDPFDDPDDVVNATAWRHEVDDPRPPAVADDLGLENQRLWPIVLIDAAHRHGGTNAPVPVPVRPEQLSEAGVGVDARQAHPIHRPAARDQRDGRRVTDETIVFERSSHAEAHRKTSHRSQPGWAPMSRAPGRFEERAIRTLVIAVLATT